MSKCQWTIGNLQRANGGGRPISFSIYIMFWLWPGLYLPTAAKIYRRFENISFYMTSITIDEKKYVLLPEKEYQPLQKKAALKTKAEKTLTLEEARAHTKKLIRKSMA